MLILTVQMILIELPEQEMAVPSRGVCVYVSPAPRLEKKSSRRRDLCVCVLALEYNMLLASNTD